SVGPLVPVPEPLHQQGKRPGAQGQEARAAQLRFRPVQRGRRRPDRRLARELGEPRRHRARARRRLHRARIGLRSMSRSSRARQRGHVARRLFLLFILSAFLPLALIAALSLGEVRSLLLQQGEQRLAATAKTYGMTVYERLLVASDVAISTAQRTTFGAAHDDLAHRTFVWITQLEPDGTARALIGRGSAPALGEDALRRLSERKPAILVARTPDVTHVILAVAKPGAERGSVVVGEVNPEYLWGSPDELPAMTDFCIVEDISGDTLHCTTPL